MPASIPPKRTSRFTRLHASVLQSPNSWFQRLFQADHRIYHRFLNFRPSLFISIASEIKSFCNSASSPTLQTFETEGITVILADLFIGIAQLIKDSLVLFFCTFASINVQFDMDVMFPDNEVESEAVHTCARANPIGLSR